MHQEEWSLVLRISRRILILSSREYVFSDRLDTSKRWQGTNCSAARAWAANFENGSPSAAGWGAATFALFSTLANTFRALFLDCQSICQILGKILGWETGLVPCNIKEAVFLVSTAHPYTQFLIPTIGNIWEAKLKSLLSNDHICHPMIYLMHDQSSVPYLALMKRWHIESPYLNWAEQNSDWIR